MKRAAVGKHSQFAGRNHRRAWWRSVCRGVLAALALIELAAMTAYAANPSQAVSAGNVRAELALSAASAAVGEAIGITIGFTVAPGWHIYGQPLPQDFVPLTVKVGDAVVAKQELQFPPPVAVKFAALGMTLPVYEGHFEVPGRLVLKRDLKPGEYALVGSIQFQECNGELCKLPETAQFSIPLKVLPAAPE